MTTPTIADVRATRAAAEAATKRADGYRVCAVTGGYDTEARESASAAFAAQMAHKRTLEAYGGQHGQNPECGHYFNCCPCWRIS